VSQLIPLFPLELVLFPGMPLPLHIFEPRYKEMIGECLQEKTEFGIVRATGNEVATIGCTATILEVLKRYDDGRMDLMTEGRRRFAVQEVNKDRSFFQAEVEFLPDADAALSPHDRSRALALAEELLRMTESNDFAVDPEVPMLSYHIAAPLPFDLDFRQTLLAERSEAERIRAVAEYLESLLPRLKRALKAKSTAGGNGHAVN
jgi:Lon protease-like protein